MYFQSRVPNTSDLFEPPENAIRNQSTPILVGRPVTNNERQASSSPQA